MSYADKKQRSEVECADRRCDQLADVIKIFHGRADWYCTWHSEQIDKLQGKNGHTHP